jgi:hypothetical protein
MEIYVLPPAARALYLRVHTLSGVIETLCDRGEQLLALAGEYSACNVIDRLLTTLRAELVEAQREMQEIQTTLSRLGIPQKTGQVSAEP